MKRKPKPDADASDAAKPDPAKPLDVCVRWLHLPLDLGVKPLKISLREGHQSEWSLVHWHNAVQSLGGQKTVCRTVDRNEASWKMWHTKMHPHCPSPGVETELGVKGSWSVVTSLFVAVLCWGAGAARRCLKDRNRGALLLAGVVHAFFEKETQPVQVSIPRLSGGGLVQLTVKQGWVDATHWLQPENDETVQGFMSDFSAAVDNPEMLWASGHVHMCKLGVLASALLVDPGERRGEAATRYAVAACHVMHQIATFFELRMKDVTSSSISAEEAKLVMPSGGLKRFNSDLKVAVCQAADDRKVPSGKLTFSFHLLKSKTFPNLHQKPGQLKVLLVGARRRQPSPEHDGRTDAEVGMACGRTMARRAAGEDAADAFSRRAR